MESVHPLIVHFPIALLLAGAGFEAAAFALKRPGLHQVSLWNLCLGALGALAAVLTGLQAEDVGKHSFEIWQVLQLHKRIGISVAILGVAIVVVRLVTRDRLSRKIRAGLFLITAVLAGLLITGAHLGGRLVYEFGVGGSFGRTL